jgi:predicted dithiol-disulfide oxidoreductase (DUF899 family)
MKTIETTLTGHKIVSREEWIAARKALLTKEKESTRLRPVERRATQAALGEGREGVHVRPT